MSVSILPYITGAGGALVVLAYGVWLFISDKIMTRTAHERVLADKDRQISDLTSALRDERTRADTATLLAQTQAPFIAALHGEAKTS